MKNVIITGAGKGIGYELTKLFIDNGECNVIAISRNVEKLELLVTENLQVISLDLTVDFSEVLSVMLESLNGSVDILINNAGYLVNKPFSEITEEDLNRSYATNVLAPFRIIQQLLPSFNTEHAHVINISSVGGVQGSVKFPGLSAYSSSKGALNILTECLAEEYKDTGLKFNCLALGAVQTEMLEKAFPDYIAPVSAAKMAQYIERFALTSSDWMNGRVVSVALSTP